MTSILLLKSLLLANKLQATKRKRKKIGTNVKLQGFRRPASKIKKIRGEMCRICNKEKGDVEIFDNSKHPDLPEEIHNFSGVMMNETDEFSKQMCINCLDLLKSCITFRKICQNTNKRLIEQSIKKELIIESNIDDVDECNIKYLNSDQEAEESDGLCIIPSPTYPDNDICCTYCEKQFCNMAKLNKHKCNNKEKSVEAQNDEVKKRKFLCDVCGKTAASNANLLAHMTTHENIFPFKCEICPYQGRTMDLLKVHKRIHLAEKPFKCSQCPKTTTSASNLQKHMRHVHSLHRPYKCTYCEKAFSFQHDMNRHIKDIHLRQSTVECTICIKKFNTKKILRGHMFKVHKVKGERQGRLPSYLQCQRQMRNNEERYQM